MKTVKPGIRLKPSGRYIATKSIDGKRYYQEFNTLREAEHWKNKFHPLINKEVPQRLISPIQSSANEFVNGRDKSITVREVYEKYLNGPLKSLGAYSQYKKPKRLERFLPPIFSIRMAELTPEVITALLEKAALGVESTYGRTSFHQELRSFKSILNWYKEEKDFSFVVPITKYHLKIAVIGKKSSVNKILGPEDLAKFIDSLPPYYKELATIQFMYGLRIGEVCALTSDTVDFKKKKIYIKQTMTWIKDIPKLKETTKTEDEAELKMTDLAEKTLLVMEKRRPANTRFLFHMDGKMPRYRYITNVFNETLKSIGINDVTGTHFLRHSAATISRKFGGIDAAQALLRHKSSAMSEHYAKLDQTEKSSEVVINAEKVFLEARRATNATKTNVKSMVTGS